MIDTTSGQKRRKMSVENLETLENDFRRISGDDLLFYERGLVLKSIKSKKLFKDLFGTWKSYCSERLDYDVRTADREIAATKVIDLLRPFGLALPINEAQARPLTKRQLKSEDKKICWEIALDTAKEKLTAVHVERVVSEYLRNKSGTNGQRLSTNGQPPKMSKFNEALINLISAINQVNNTIIGVMIDTERDQDKLKSWLSEMLDGKNLDQTNFRTTRSNQEKLPSTGDTPKMFYGYNHEELRLGFAIMWNDQDQEQDQMVLLLR